jgi:5-methyltetrahydrofolate--homocysteine methyltransferase
MLKTKLPLILDTATGTTYMKYGMKPGEKSWKFAYEHPDMLYNFQKGLYDIGSDAVLTSTFGIVQGKDPINIEAAVGVSKVAREAAGSDKLVIGAVSPIGRYLYPYGDMRFDEAVERYGEVVSAIDPYVDMFMTETNIQTSETRAAVCAFKKYSDKPVIATLTIDQSGKTLSGDLLLPSLFTLADAGADCFGVNCSFGAASVAEHLIPIVPYAEAIGVTVAAKPNAGLPDKPTPVEEFAAAMQRMYDAGVSVIGGCCGTGPEHIVVLKEMIERSAPGKITPADVDFSRIVSNTRAYAEIGDDLPDPVEISEFLSDDIDEQDEDYAVIKIEKGQADELMSQLPYINKPFALCGDFDEYEKFRRVYCGKTIFIK